MTTTGQALNEPKALGRWPFRHALWISGVIILTVGWIFNESDPDMNWFSRAGCLVVLLGIISGFMSVIQQRFVERTVHVRKLFAIRKIRRLHRDDAEESDKLISELETRFRDHLDSTRISIQFELGITEFTMLGLGTLVWGFGDLL